MLTIQSIDLYKFQGMWLNKISHFTLSDISRYQLILGRNGCGKSRLIRILSLIAPTKTDFEVGGYRTLKLSFNEVNYTLHCLRTKTAFKCTIKTDDEVLYDAVNPTVYNTAIKELFNYDKDVHDLITGKVLFTSMRTPERKKWFSILSESDLTYALSFYKKSREHLRDFTGAIKNLKHSIGLLQPKVLESREELAQTKLRIEKMQSTISGLDIKIAALPTDQSVTEQTIDELQEFLDRMSQELFATEVHVPSVAVKYNRQQTLEYLARCETEYSLRMDQLSELIKKVEHYSKIKSIDLAKLDSVLQELNEQITDLKSKQLLFGDLANCPLSDLETAQAMYDYYAPIFNSCLYHLSQVDNPVNVEATTAELASRCAKYKQLHMQRTAQLERLNEQLAHIQGTCDVSCTKCGHKFKPGLADNANETILANINTITEELSVIATKLNDAIEQHDQYCLASNGVQAVRQAMESCGSNTASALLFDYLNKADGFNSNKPYLNNAITQYRQELDNAITLWQLQSRYDKVELDATVIRANQSEDHSEVNQQIANIEEQIAKLSEQLLYWRGILKALDDTDARLARLDQLDTKIAQTLERQYNALDTLAYNQVAIELIKERTDVWDLLITTKQRFEDMDRERVKLELLEADLITAQSRKKATESIVTALSPDGGILAKYLYQSITKVTDLMTGYINSIWGYELGVLPCKVDGNELDYKFPFYANDAAQLTEDVSLGSKAQQEVINFVFMLSVYQAMGLEGYPLFLDELGSGFDEGHRPAMIDFIKGLIDRGYHSQVFMVSHDPQTHFQLAHAQVCVIDANGITLPAVYNKNVTIKY